nr:hypothetical protein [Tanacetum cinerariifolium]
MTSPEMRETKAYKTYLGYATGVTPLKITRKFKKAYPYKKDINLNLVHVDEEPKSAKKKVPTMKTTRKQSSGVVLRDTLVVSVSKKKEKVHQFWDSVHKHDTSYRFRMGRKKKFYRNLETFRYIFQIWPRVHGQDFDELPTDEVIVSFFKELGHSGEIKSITNVVVDQMHQPWRTFATIINRSLSGKITGLDKLRVTPLKIARKFKKAYPYKKDINLNLVPVDEEPKSAKKKVPTMKTTRKQSLGVVLRDTLVVSVSKKKEKVIVDKGKGIELLSEVALTKKAQLKEVYKKSMRDFHRTHPSDSGSNSEQETNENETGSEFDQQENEGEVKDDQKEKEDEFVKTPSNYTPTDDKDETNEESKVKDNIKGVDNKRMDYTTNKFDDNVDVRLNDPVHADEGFIQKKGTDAEMINV